jgi:hypothetical protein
MKPLMTIVAMGLSMAVATGTAFASGDEHHDSRSREHAERAESKIYGTVKSLPGGLIGIWHVNGREVKVTQNTLIREKHGKAAVGAYVEAEGSLDGNVLNATRIEVKRDSRESRKLHGTIESLGKDGSLMVNGEKVLVNKDTLVREKHGKTVVGAYVEVEGVSSGNAIAASKIEVKRQR